MQINLGDCSLSFFWSAIRQIVDLSAAHRFHTVTSRVEPGRRDLRSGVAFERLTKIQWAGSFTNDGMGRRPVMHDGDWGFWGMHLFWWLFWIVLLVAFFSLLTPVPRRRARETPLEVLQRRYAAGEISTEEYEKRKTTLTKDRIQ
jgi:putative membrane protein